MNKTALLEEKTAELTKARDIAAKAEAETRDLTEDERSAVKAHVDAAKKAHDQILEIDGDAALIAQMNALGEPLGNLAKGGGLTLPKAGSLGERFEGADAYQQWLKSVAPAGRVPETSKGLASPAFEFKLADVLPSWGAKDILAGGDVEGAGALVVAQWLGLLDGLAQFQRPLTIVDMITRGTTSGDTVEYARVTGFTNNAATVAEARGTSDGDASGDVVGRKPESSLQLEKVTANVKTIAHWLPATKRALSDAGQIRTLIDQFLRYGLAEELEDQIMSGDDTGENFEGILEVDGTQHQPFDTDILVTARKARTLVRVGGRATPTAYLLHPNDNERYDLTKDLEGRYYFGGPSALGSNQPLWSLPRIESEAVPEGTGLVGDWRTCVLWDREQAAIQVSDSHADFFVRNLVAILAEMRAAFGIVRPPAIATFDLEAGS